MFYRFNVKWEPFYILTIDRVGPTDNSSHMSMIQLSWSDGYFFGMSCVKEKVNISKYSLKSLMIMMGLHDINHMWKYVNGKLEGSNPSWHLLSLIYIVIFRMNGTIFQHFVFVFACPCSSLFLFFAYYRLFGTRIIKIGLHI